MIPHAEQALLDLATKLALEVAPATTNDYVAANATQIALLLQVFAQECEHGIDLRWQDILQLKTLFQECVAAPEFGSGLASDLTSQLAAFCYREPSNLGLSSLTELHDEGMALLIQLQIQSETRPDGDINRKIWHFLEVSTKRHSYAVLM